MTEAATRLGTILREARTRRGLPLARAEQETKIRTRYLSALESGDLRALPGPVYARGFLRSYAGYLGLDGERLMALYRIAIGAAIGPASAAPVRVSARPRPIALPRALAIGRRTLLGMTLLVGMTGMVAWLGHQLTTYTTIPTLTITDPGGDRATSPDLRYVIRGQTAANATVSVSGLGENPTVRAAADGRFALEVRLEPGLNLVSLEAYDPLTGRVTEPQTLTIVAGSFPEPAAAEDPVQR